jgi:hypothetical protein
VELDPERLPRVGGTTAGSYRRLAKDILLAVPRSGYVQVEGDARRSLDEMNRIAREVGRRQALVVLVDHVRSQDAGSRRVWQREMDRDLVCCLALVTQSLLGRAVASFFVGLRRPAVPTKLFATVDEAVPWCMQQLEAYDRRALG